jgi:rare lipoprotein A (peptidoglycan hydrolase)
MIGLMVLLSSFALNNSYAMASWYGPGLYGNNLGCGGVLTTRTVGVAHKSFRCGTRVRICYRRCATFRVIDRGPYVYGREFDLTYPARVMIGAPNGVFRVRYQIVR